MYRNAWPLLALATYQQILDAKSAKSNGHRAVGSVSGSGQLSAAMSR
jgi:hypothetical protein